MQHVRLLVLGHPQLQLSALKMQSEHGLAAGSSVCYHSPIAIDGIMRCHLQVTLNHGRLLYWSSLSAQSMLSVKPALCTDCQE